MLVHILILEWDGMSTKIAQRFPRNMLCGPGEIFLGARIWGLAEKLLGGRHPSSPFS